MNIFEVKADKKQYLPLLLLADEQEDMIDRYLERGTMYALKDGASVRAVCVVTDEGESTLELKNLAAAPEYQRRGYGRRLVDFLAEAYRGQYRRLLVGTGDSPLTPSTWPAASAAPMWCPAFLPTNTTTPSSRGAYS